MLWFQEANQNQGEYFRLSKGSWSDTFAYIIDILERGMADGSFRQLDPLLTTVQILNVCNATKLDLSRFSLPSTLDSLPYTLGYRESS